VNLSVIDTGIGIAVDRQRRLFRPFVQIDSRLSREYSGTGLGLALVKRLADLHGGGVALQSKPGGGSTFTVSLPLRQDVATSPPEADVAASTPAVEVQGNPRILVAEDSPTNIAMLRAYFRSQTCQLVLARDGKEAIDRALAEIPDIIIMDVMMPRMDGLEAMKRLRADPRTAGVPVVCLTALAMSGDEERCLAAGADAFLCKPINFGVLATTINRLVATASCPDESLLTH
jgi:CheY-like chemotaxis protein